MEVYKNILVLLDGLELSESILPEVERLASALKCRLSILRVAYTYGGLLDDPSKHQAKVIGEADESVKKIKKRLKEKGLNVESHITYGADTAKRILDHVDEYENDLIMMSTHGYTGTKNLLLGSVVKEVVRNTKKPILLVRTQS